MHRARSARRGGLGRTLRCGLFLVLPHRAFSLVPVVPPPSSVGSVGASLPEVWTAYESALAVYPLETNVATAAVLAWWAASRDSTCRASLSALLRRSALSTACSSLPIASMRACRAAVDELPQRGGGAADGASATSAVEAVAAVARSCCGEFQDRRRLRRPTSDASRCCV